MTMVYRQLFPRGGGGWLRRYLKFRQGMLWKTFDSDVYPITPAVLFDLSRHDDQVDARKIHEDRLADGWRISDDRVIGGFTESTATFLRTHEDYSRHIAGQPVLEWSLEDRVKAAAAAASGQASSSPPSEKTSDKNGLPSANNEKEISTKTQDKFTPFIRWQGTLDTAIGLESDAHRSGFAALQSPEFAFSGACLEGLFDALEIVCRADARTYNVNLKVSSFIPGDVFQGRISVPQTTDRGKHFDTLFLPFEAFRLTAMGREREIPRELDNRITIQSIGFTLMDGENGDFCFDLARIRAVNFLDNAIYEGPPPPPITDKFKDRMKKRKWYESE